MQHASTGISTLSNQRSPIKILRRSLVSHLTLSIWYPAINDRLWNVQIIWYCISVNFCSPVITRLMKLQRSYSFNVLTTLHLWSPLVSDITKPQINGSSIIQLRKPKFNQKLENKTTSKTKNNNQPWTSKNQYSGVFEKQKSTLKTLKSTFKNKKIK